MVIHGLANYNNTKVMSNAIDERLYTDDALIELIEKHFKEYVDYLSYTDVNDLFSIAAEGMSNYIDDFLSWCEDNGYKE